MTPAVHALVDTANAPPLLRPALPCHALPFHPPASPAIFPDVRTDGHAAAWKHTRNFLGRGRLQLGANSHWGMGGGGEQRVNVMREMLGSDEDVVGQLKF